MDKNSSRGSKNSKSPKELSEDDANSIFNDVGHIRNRDEIATSGNRIVQGGSSSDIDDTWEFERKSHLQGDASDSPEAVDAQFRNIATLHEDVRNSDSHHNPTLAKPGDRRDVLSEMDDEELMSIADTLGIPEREELSHMSLVMKIREYEMRGL